MGLQQLHAGRNEEGAARPATDSLWAYYTQARDPGVREELVAAYAGFARIMAAKAYARRMNAEMEFGDYLQYAMLGLLESVDRFEPGRGFKFETFAARRITGAILNGIESSSELQEQIAARRRILAQRTASLGAQAGAPQGPEAVFARLAELAIGLAVGFALEESRMVSGGSEDYPDNSYHGVELKQLRERIKAALANLPQNQRHVISAHYLQHLAFDDIAAGMRLTRGRVSQIHKEALGNLRARLQDQGEIDLRC
jgi:RNA polymerase sigma factor FliA